jgi:hypothetical protein
MSKILKYSDEEIAFIIERREKHKDPWHMLASHYLKKFKIERSPECIRKAYYKNAELLAPDDSTYVKKMVENERQRRANSLNSKENKFLVNHLINQENFLDAIKEVTKRLGKAKIPAPIKPSKDKSPMTLELLISDVHVGKKTEKFDHSVLKRRLKQIADTTLKEIERARVHYNVERIIIAFMGDLIESFSMHGLESAKNCEFGNSRQVQEALEQLYRLILEPIAATGIPIDCVGVTGNHDRTEEERTFSNPGQDNLTWIIYNSMKLIGEARGLKNVTWHIPVVPYCADISIYGENVLYEHYDNVKGSDKVKGIEGLYARRMRQLEKVLHFIRGGHFHEPIQVGIGKMIINGSVPGDDGFSTTLGFRCEPSQTLNFYIKKKKDDSIKRTTSFYKSLLIQLD